MLRLTRCSVLVVILILAGCTSPEEYYQVARQQRAARHEVSEILASIQDAKSMAAAETALEERYEKFEAIARKASAMPKPPPEVQKRFEEDLPAMQRSINRYNDEVKRVRDLPGGREFLKHFESKHPGLLSAVQQ